jgi:hypothetical protein
MPVNPNHITQLERTSSPLVPPSSVIACEGAVYEREKKHKGQKEEEEEEEEGADTEEERRD